MTPETITPELLKSLTAIICAAILTCTAALIYVAVLIDAKEGYGKIGLMIFGFLFAALVLILIA